MNGTYTYHVIFTPVPRGWSWSTFGAGEPFPVYAAVQAATAAAALADFQRDYADRIDTRFPLRVVRRHQPASR